jgi:multidrug efflux pump subunit AcrA (membrane-fusion protein)
VKRGTTLATLEARDKAQAVRAAAIAQQRQAAHAARSVRLRDATLITADEAEAAKYDEEQRAAELDLVRVLVDDAIIRAPFDGVIVARFVEPGTHVAAGTPMLRMIDPQGARIRFGVPPEVANTIATGQAVRFSTPSIPCKAFGSACPGSHEAAAQSARITSVSPEVDRSAGLVVVEADVGEISAFRSGTQVTVFLAEEAATSARGLLSP